MEGGRRPTLKDAAFHPADHPIETWEEMRADRIEAGTVHATTPAELARVADHAPFVSEEEVYGQAELSTVSQQASRQVVDRALGGLSGREQLVVKLSLIEGVSTRDIATSIERSPRTARRVLRTALDKINSSRTPSR